MNLDINAIAKEIRKELKTKFPEWKFSVTIDKFAGGRELNVALMAGPVEAADSNPPSHYRNGYAQLNHYTFLTDYGYGQDEMTSNGTQLTPVGYQVLREATRIANRENYDNSDLMTDYFDVNYYLSVAIGKWNRPYEVNH